MVALAASTEKPRRDVAPGYASSHAANRSPMGTPLSLLDPSRDLGNVDHIGLGVQHKPINSASSPSKLKDAVPGPQAPSSQDRRQRLLATRKATGQKASSFTPPAAQTKAATTARGGTRKEFKAPPPSQVHDTISHSMPSLHAALSAPLCSPATSSLLFWLMRTRLRAARVVRTCRCVRASSSKARRCAAKRLARASERALTPTARPIYLPLPLP
jgi:hypothetical protein